MMEKQETFDQYLERSLTTAGLRSYGHNNFDDREAELMCYKRAVFCFFPKKGTTKEAPASNTTPPWGIHTTEHEDAPHEAPVGDDSGRERIIMHAEFRKALNLAAHVVEEEAILFDGEAQEIMPSENEGPSNRKEWEQFLIARGRVHSLRRLAREIRNIKQ